METKTTLLYQSDLSLVNKLKEYFQTDVQKARIIALSKDCRVYETWLFEDSDDTFRIISVEIKYGVSTNNKLYFRKKETRKLFINKGKFYIVENKRIMPVYLANLTSNSEKEVLKSKFSWIRFLEETGLSNMLFNTVVKYKLYNYNDCVKYLYKVPLPLAKFLHNMTKTNYQLPPKIWKEMKKWCTHFENFNPDLFNDAGYLQDCCFMAQKLNRKVNLSWSVRRLKEEHDEWSRITTNVLYECINAPLKIKDSFIKLQELTNWNLLTDTKSLALEGMKQCHCVGGYENNVNSGNCAIFNIENYTAQIGISNNKYILMQYRGLRNADAPVELRSKVEQALSYASEMYLTSQALL